MSDIGKARSNMERARQNLEVSRDAAAVVGAPHAKVMVELQTNQAEIMEDAKSVSAMVKEKAGELADVLGRLGLLIVETEETQRQMYVEGEQVGMTYGVARDSAAEALELTTATLDDPSRYEEDPISRLIDMIRYRNDRIARGGSKVSERAGEAVEATPNLVERLGYATRQLKEIQDGVDIIVSLMSQKALEGAYSPTNDQLLVEMKETDEDGGASAYNQAIQMIDERIGRL